MAARLNQLMVGTDIAYCNGLSYDQVWFRNLFGHINLEPAFHLADMWSMPGLDHEEHALRLFYWFNKVKLSVHRAGPNSAFLLEGYAFALGFQPQIVALQ